MVNFTFTKGSYDGFTGIKLEAAVSATGASEPVCYVNVSDNISPYFIRTIADASAVGSSALGWRMPVKSNTSDLIQIFCLNDGVENVTMNMTAYFKDFAAFVNHGSHTF